MLLTGVIRLDNISEVYCRRNAKICYLCCQPSGHYTGRVRTKAVAPCEIRTQPCRLSFSRNKSLGDQETINVETLKWGRILIEKRGRMVPQPREASEVLLDSDEGVKRAKITVGAAVVQKHFWCFLFQRYPKWDRLRRLVAWHIRVFTQTYTSKITGCPK